jgi:hypothetical protein
MQIWRVMILAPAIVLAAACHKKDDRAAADSALSRDLNLANQVAPYDSISPTEAGISPDDEAADDDTAKLQRLGWERQLVERRYGDVVQPR